MVESQGVRRQRESRHGEVNDGGAYQGWPSFVRGAGNGQNTELGNVQTTGEGTHVQRLGEFGSAPVDWRESSELTLGWLPRLDHYKNIRAGKIVSYSTEDDSGVRRLFLPLPHPSGGVLPDDGRKRVPQKTSVPVRGRVDERIHEFVS